MRRVLFVARAALFLPLLVVGLDVMAIAGGCIGPSGEE